ncbi:MAG: hypothetical protein HY738_05395 [Bacteroidia bacterium]|nr:hypothetical protein [Bacteroidia bacterium]
MRYFYGWLSNTILLSLIIFVLPVAVMPQDIIMLNENEETIECRIVKDYITKLAYRKWNSTDTTTYYIKYGEYEGYILEKDRNPTAETKSQFDTLNMENETPEYIMEFSGGIGSNYGLIGGRFFLGYNNTGLLFGLGYAYIVLPVIGARVSHGNAYLTISLAPHRIYTINKTTVAPYTVSFMGGYMIPVLHGRLFIDLGAGCGFGKPISVYYGTYLIDEIKTSGLIFNLGLGVRFLNVKKKK